MAPPCQAFPVNKLELHVQVGPDQKVRKTENSRRIDLAKDCELSELFQYDCFVANPEVRDCPIECWPIRRLFRTCQTKNGKYTAETTSWEAWKKVAGAATADTSKKEAATW